MKDSECDHEFIFGGVRYEIKDWKLPGSNAQPVHYFTWFYCVKCRESRYIKLEPETNTYQRVLFGAVRKWVNQKERR